MPRNDKGGYELKRDEKTLRLGDVDVKPAGGMLYEYGFDWTHEVAFEKKVNFNEKLQYPVCIAGAMSVPPDAEFGGAMEYMEARRRKRSNDFRVRTFINGLPHFPEPKPGYRNFDHRHFDLDEINARLGVHSPEKRTKSKLSGVREDQVNAPQLYQFKVIYCEVTPPIWRRVFVSSDTSLSRFAPGVYCSYMALEQLLKESPNVVPWVYKLIAKPSQVLG